MKNVLAGFQKRYHDGELDDTDYASIVKTVIEQATAFLDDNPEIGTSADLLRKFLYEAAKAWWMERIDKLQTDDATEDGPDPPPDDAGFGDYYFDYIYKRGIYPD